MGLLLKDGLGRSPKGGGTVQGRSAVVDVRSAISWGYGPAAFASRKGGIFSLARCLARGNA